MNELLALWNASLAMSAAALAAVTLLIAARGTNGGRSKQRQRARSEMIGALLSEEAERLPGTRLHLQVAAELTIELAEMVRGSDRERLLSKAADLGVPGVLVRRLRSRNPQDRLTAAETLAIFPGEPQRAALAALGDRNRDVRLGAALALAQNHAAPPAAEVVRELGVGAGEHSLLVVSLMRDLAETDPEGVTALLHDPDLPDEAKLAASDALASGVMVENPPLMAWMAEMAKANRHLQPRIFRALGRIGHPAARDAVLLGLESKEWPVRSAAAEAAGRIGLTDAVARLRELLSDDQWWVRLRASEALVRMGRAGHEALLVAAQSDDERARGAAAVTLAEHRLV